MTAQASATPVATDDASYAFLGRVFPDPMAGCQNNGKPPCDPNAEGNVPASQFIGIDEFQDALRFMNQRPAWRRYMEVWALDGHMGDGASGGMFPGNNRSPEFDPKAEYVSAGLPTTGAGRRKSDLMVVRVTDESVPDRGKKRYALSLSIHGIERAGAEGGTRAMEDLVTAATTGNRSSQPLVPAAVKRGAPTYAQVLRKAIIYFTYPNPDGWRRGSVSSGGVFFQRYNGNGVDPNRDWPDVGYAFRPYSAVSEPETQAWIAFYNDVKRKTGSRFAAGDDLHGQPEADALSYTLLPHGRHRYDKNNRIQETAKRINRGTYEAIKWSPIVQDNDQPQGGGVPCAPDAVLGTACAKIYAQTWGSVYDTINYTTTGALGDWFDSSIGLGADGIDNEMSFSHLDKNIVFEPQTEQLHVEGNRALIFAHLAEILEPSYDTTFDARGRKGYVPTRRITRSETRNFPGAPPGTHPDGPIDADEVAPAGATHDFTVKRTPEIYNGGMRVEVTNGNLAGIGSGSVTLEIQCKGCDEHPGTKDDEGYVTVAEDYNQSPLYAQAGVVATVNDPQARTREGKPVAWRAVVDGPSGVVHFHIVFTKGPASSDGDTGGGPPPVQHSYDVANTDFFDNLNRFIPLKSEDLRPIDPKAVLAGKQRLSKYDTIALADDPLPGYTGPYGRSLPTGPPTKTQTFSGSASAPGGVAAGTTPGSFEEKEFTVGSNDANGGATVRLDWAEAANDFDLTVFREVDGKRTVVGSSAGGFPDKGEQVKIPEPEPGKYVIRVENFAAPDPRWTATVRFDPLPASRRNTGSYTTAQKNEWIAKLRTWARAGGNLVLTDGALRLLPELASIPATAVSRQTVYAGQSAFATAEDKPTTKDFLARGIVQQGARFNAGMRRQMYEPTPLGFAIQDPGGADASFARQYDVSLKRWQDAGGRTVATSADAGARDAQPVYDRVTIGELPFGRGRVRIAGALLPQPTEAYDHQFGLEPYSTTYTGYIIARNLLDTRNRAGFNSIGGRFVISRRAVKLRGRVARVRVSCRTPLGCKGRLYLQVRKRVRGRHGKRRTKLVTIGSKRFKYRSKRRNAVLRVKLSRRGRALAARAKRRTRIHAKAPMRFTDGRRGTARRAFWLYRPSRR